MVSIILCTYNRAHLLNKAIDSVLKQTYTRWELIVIDDGSVDYTSDVVKDYQKKDNRIIYFFQTNKGPAKSRNVGLQIAKGNFICFVDSDDQLGKTHVEKRMDYLQKNTSIDFLHGGMKLIGDKKKHYVVDARNPNAVIHLSECYIGGTFFFRKKILKKVKGFRMIPYAEDFDLFKRVKKSFKIKKVTFPTYLYHLDSENRLCDILMNQKITAKQP